MNTLHFKYALEVARTGSITQAADNLYMAQPNLSKAIRELEDTLGIAIFRRTPRGMVPTQKGLQFLEHARKALEQVEQMEALSQSGNQSRQSFSISIPRVSYISKAVTQFLATLDPAQDMDINIQETNSMSALANITDGRFDLGIIRYPLRYETYFFDFLRQKELKSELVWEFDFVAVMSRSHPLAQADTVAAEQLEHYPEILHGDIGVPYLPAGELQQASPKHIYVYERCSQFDLLSSLPSTYMWVSPISAEILERYGLVIRSCPREGQRQKDVLVYPSGHRLTPLERRFIDRLYAVRNEAAFAEYR